MNFFKGNKLKYGVILILSFCHSLVFATHIRGGYISATLLEANTYTYRIALNSFTDAGSTVAFGGGEMLFGDGSDPVQFTAGEPDFFKLLDDDVALNVFYVEHSFPGPGTYTISYREFNRNAGIANMSNSVNTPFYLETVVKADPFIGVNSTPVISNYFPFMNETHKPYIFPLVANDQDGDSLSYETVIPKQDKNVPVEDYYIPASFEGDRIISQLQLHTPANLLVWANPLTEDEFNYAVKIREWRYVESMDSYEEIGFTIFDFQLIFADHEDNASIVQNVSDTAVLESSRFDQPITITDPENDSMMVRITSDLPDPSMLEHAFDPDAYYPTPIEKNISLVTEGLERIYPYKIAISIYPKGSGKIVTQESFMLWVTNKPGLPAAPGNLEKELAFREKIIFSWRDNSDNEAGFTVERADSFFPEFIRIAGLPANTTGYTDNNIIPNRDYYYRVNAIGTEGHATSEVLEINELDIVTGFDDESSADGVRIYPNPSDDILRLEFNPHALLPENIEILGITGRIHKKIKPGTMHNSTIFTIPVHDLPAQMYLLRIIWKDHLITRKFMKN